MKLLFINCAYPQECYERLHKESNGMLSAPINDFNVIFGISIFLFTTRLFCTNFKKEEISNIISLPIVKPYLLVEFL